MVDTKKLLEQAKAYDTSRGVIAAAPVNPAKRTSASAGGVDTAKLLAQAKAYDAAKSADPRQAAQTAPNTPVAKGSFTGNRETTYTPKFSAGKLVAGTVEKGLNEFSQGIGATATMRRRRTWALPRTRTKSGQRCTRMRRAGREARLSCTI